MRTACAKDSDSNMLTWLGNLYDPFSDSLLASTLAFHFSTTGENRYITAIIYRYITASAIHSCHVGV